MMRARGIRALAFVAAATCAAACESVPLVAPTQSTLTLVAGASIVPVGGSTTVTARVVEAAGTPVHDGTVVTFSANLGTIHPAEVATVRGQARATFTAGSTSGVAELRAFSGDGASEAVRVAVGAAAVGAIRVTAQPTSLPPGGGAATVTATVLDSAQNPLPHVPVTFRSSVGVLQHNSATSDGGGNARTVLNTSSTAVVTATAGDNVEAATTITVDPLTSIGITATPAAPVAGQVVTFTVTLTNERHAVSSATIAFGDGESQRLGATTRVAVTHTYQRPGAYTVTVRATDAAGNTTSSSTVMQVAQAPGIAVGVTSSPSSPVVGQPVTFTVTVTPPANGPTVRSAVIEYGNGAKETLGALSGTTTVAHVYETPGSRIVRVVVEDTADRQHAASIGLTVARTPAVAVSLAASPSAPVVGQPVTFTVTVTSPANGHGISSVRIDFGDGTRESLGALTGTTTVTHRYSRADSYVVKATAHDTADQQSEASIGVTVSDG